MNNEKVPPNGESINVTQTPITQASYIQSQAVLGKGYAYLFSIALTALVCWQSVEIKYTKNNGLELQTKEIPVHVLAGYAMIMGALAGIDTNRMATTLGNFLSAGRKVN